MINESYNHMVIQKTCRTCDGEGIVPRPGYAGAAQLLEEISQGKSAALASALDPDSVDEAAVPDDLPPLEDC